MILEIILGQGHFSKSTKITANPKQLKICSGRYLKLQCGEQLFQSNIVKTSTPNFQQKFEFQLIPTQRPMILLEYYEKLSVKGDKYKGFVMIHTNHLSFYDQQIEIIEFSNGSKLEIFLTLKE